MPAGSSPASGSTAPSPAPRSSRVPSTSTTVSPGAVWLVVPAAAFRERYGFPYRVIHRADLQSLLADAVARTPTIALRLGTSVAGASEAADGLSVHLTRDRGNETVEAAALIAADGVRSALRAFVPGAAPARPTGRTAWRARRARRWRPPVIDAAAVGLWLGPDAHLVHYPVAHGTAVNIVAIVEERGTRPAGMRPAIRRPSPHGSPPGAARCASSSARPTPGGSSPLPRSMRTARGPPAASPCSATPPTP